MIVWIIGAYLAGAFLTTVVASEEIDDNHATLARLSAIFVAWPFVVVAVILGALWRVLTWVPGACRALLYSYSDWLGPGVTRVRTAVSRILRRRKRVRLPRAVVHREGVR